MHADVTKLSEALGYDDRIGRRFLHAGLGFGGGCLPKDIRAFMARAEELGAQDALAFLEEVDDDQQAAPGPRGRPRPRAARRVVSRARRCACWGAAFKPNSDDIRDSPALDVAVAVQPSAAPRWSSTTPRRWRTRGGRTRSWRTRPRRWTRPAARTLVLLLTEWAEFREMDPAELGEVVGARRIVDGRNALDPAAWRAAGWTYRALGRP